MSGKNKLSVLFCNYWARKLGGAEYSLTDILESASQIWECHLVTAENGPLVDNARKSGATCHIIRSRWSPHNIRREKLVRAICRSPGGFYSFLSYVVRLAILIKKINPSLMHANVPKSHMACILLKFFGCKTPCCLHMRELFDDKSTPLLLYRMLFNSRSTSVIAVSHAVKDCLPRSMQTASTVLYNGVTIAKTARRRQLKKTIRFIYLGRIVPWKGCSELIDMFADLQNECGSTRVSLTLSGSTAYWPQNYRDTLKNKIAAYGMEQQCSLLPHTEQPLSLLCEHDVFCISSYNEPFGRVVAEAQGCGLPVVGWNSGGLNEIVDHSKSGFLVTYGDFRAFVKAMKKFVFNPGCIDEMGSKGRRKAKIAFNRNKQIPLLCDYLEKQIRKEQTR
ncbi:MAG: glycosyltransferase [Chitinivibrionales bacterium]|nr:glycosyltransferase [Chitinivibrionales bacterium]